jgi:CubicO group peptidase (beta-lactamase class C family)
MNTLKYNLLLALFVIFCVSCRDGGITENQNLFSFEWTTSSPEEQGLSSAQISLAFQEGENRSTIYSFVVIRNGYLVAEKYYHSFSKSTVFNIKSVSKSYISAMVGIAIRDNFIDGIEEKMLDYFPEYVTSDFDARKYEITIEHLLTMKGGIDNEHNNYMILYNSANWIKNTIEFPLTYNPGERFSYNTFSTHLLSGIITKETRMTTMEFGQKFLCDQLGIKIHDWEQDPQGIYFGGNAMQFTTRDMARLGYLYMNNGNLNGSQIVPLEWVTASLTNHLNPRQGDWGELKNVGYGYLWWLGEMKGYEVFMALGYGGQFIINFPELQMIVAANSNGDIYSWEEADENERSVLDVVANYILPAVM